MALPIATVTSTHSCPMFTGTTPHVGGVIISGATTVLLNNLGIARIGDKCQCADGSIAIIIQGCNSILVEGKPVAYVGCMTSHGGVITSGSPSAFIEAIMANKGKSTAIEDVETVTMPIELMPPFAAKKFLGYLTALTKKGKEAEEKKRKIEELGYLVDFEFSF